MAKHSERTKEKIRLGLKRAYLEGRRKKYIGTKLIDVYFAGLFDGEGWVGTTENNFGYYSLRCVIGMTNKFVLEEATKYYGGSIYFHSIHEKKPNYKDQYYWQLNSKTAWNFIKRIFPYLRIKKKQAELAMEFYRFHKKADVERKKQISFELKRLNHRGFLNA